MDHANWHIKGQLCVHVPVCIRRELTWNDNWCLRLIAMVVWFLIDWVEFTMLAAMWDTQCKKHGVGCLGLLVLKPNRWPVIGNYVKWFPCVCCLQDWNWFPQIPVWAGCLYHLLTACSSQCDIGRHWWFPMVTKAISRSPGFLSMKVMNPNTSIWESGT